MVSKLALPEPYCSEGLNLCKPYHFKELQRTYVWASILTAAIWGIQWVWWALAQGKTSNTPAA